MNQRGTRLEGLDRSRRRPWSAVGNALLLVALAIIAGGVTSSGRHSDAPVSGGRPQLIVDGSVAADFETLALETWDQFLKAFEARSDCFGDVHLKAARDLHSRAGYDPDTATVTVRVPGTRAMLQSALVHEWAHHVEFQCAAHEELWPAFLAAQGVAPGTPWRPDAVPVNTPASAWADIPSEQYAEATIVLVLGGRQIPTKVRVRDEAVRVIAEWAAGDRPAERSVEARGD